MVIVVVVGVVLLIGKFNNSCKSNVYFTINTDYQYNL